MDLSYTLEPFGEYAEYPFTKYDPMILFECDESFMDDIMLEASEAKKENIIQKIKNIILKALRWIREHVSRLINGIRSIGKKNITSPNAICDKLNIRPRRKRDPNDFSQKAADSFYNDFITKVHDGKITINPYKLMMNHHRTEVSGREINGGGTRAMAVINLIIDPKPLDDYIRLFTKMTNTMSLSSVTVTDINKLFDECKPFTGRPSAAGYAIDKITSNKINKSYTSVEFSIEQMMAFQLKVDDITKVAERFDNVWDNLNILIRTKGPQGKVVEKKYMDILNELSWVCVNLQGGLHAIMNNMKGVYLIAPEYYGSISDPKVLAKFVAACMDYGIPNKYLVNNIYMISDVSLKGSANPDKPNMGFGRMTLIPPEGNAVYKVAINRYGVRSNKNDFMVMEAVRGKPLARFFAVTYESYEDYTINVMEKVDAGKSNQPNMIEAGQLGNTINAELDKANAGFHISDIKADAFGKKDGRYVIYDYGYIVRNKIKGIKG